MKLTKIVLVPFALAACNSDMHSTGPDAMPGTEPDLATAVIASGDFNVTGILSAVRVPQGVVTPNVVAGVAGGDPFLRHFGDEIFIINRDSGDNVTILDEHSFSLVQQIATGTGGNPQDVAPVGRKLYVAELAATGVVVIDRDAPDTRTTIDLSALDAADGHPDCVSVAAVGDRVFVACGILDSNFQPRGPGKIAVIDSKTDTVTSSFDLPDKNPAGYLTQVAGLDGDLVIALAPDFQKFDTGGLARVSTGATPAAHGYAVTNAALGGIANHLDLSPDGKSLWIDATAYDANFNLSGKVVALDLATLALAPSAMTPSSVLATDVAACPNGFAAVVDSTFGAAGVRIFRPDGSEMTTGAVDFGRAPDFGNNTICY